VFVDGRHHLLLADELLEWERVKLPGKWRRNGEREGERMRERERSRSDECGSKTDEKQQQKGKAQTDSW
jgi:hypothetical protein